MKKLLILLLLPLGLKAQKSPVIRFNVLLKQSVGPDQLSVHYAPLNNIYIEHYTRKKFNNPQVELSGDILWGVSDRFHAGINSGLNLNFSETYLSSSRITSIAIPLRVVCQYKACKILSGHAGVEASAGLLLFKINDTPFEEYKSGAIYNGAVFYSHKRHSFKAGFEKRADRVTFFADNINSPPIPEQFKYSIVRTALTLGWGFRISR